MIGEVRHFRFWCQKVLPLVYDNSLSYYEVLCKVVTYINKLIDSDKEIIENIDALKADMAEVQKWIDNFDYKAVEKIMKEIIDKYVATMVFFNLTDDGYFIALIPDSWDDITFGTTGLDIFPAGIDYGHLTLNY